MTHTPGPYRVQYDDRIEYGPVVAGEGFCVAKIMRYPPEWRDNAALFAAAPELLTALVGLLPEVKLDGRPVTEQITANASAHGDDVVSRVIRAQAAIAKAQDDQ